MSQWNLSVRLTGEGSDLSRTLRSTSADARAASRDITTLRRDIGRLRTETTRPIRIRLDVDAGHLRRDVQAAVSGASNGTSLRVRLGVDARHLRTEVTAAMRGASTGSNIRIPLSVDAARLRSEVNRALRAAGSGHDITIPLRTDAARLRAEVNRALRAAGSGNDITIPIRADTGTLVRDTARATRNLTALRDLGGDTARVLHQIARAARGAGDDLGHLATNATAANAALRTLNTTAGRAGGRFDTMSTQSRTLRSDLNDLDGTVTRLGGNLGGLRGRVGGSGGSGGGGGGLGDFGLAGLIPIATAAIPLIGGITASLGPAAGTFAAAGAGAAAFGLAVAGQIGPLTEAADAEKKYREAVDEHGQGSAEAAQAQLAYQRTLAAMPPETQRASVALSSLKTTFGDWSDDMAQFTMAPVEKGFTILEQVIPALTPEVKSFSTQMDRLMNVAGGAVSTSAFDALVDKAGELTDTQLDSFTDQVIHLLRVVSEGNVGGGAIGQILAYFRENGPAARDAVEAIGDAVSTLAQGASQAGPTMLTLVTAAARLVAAMPPELVAIILQVVAALKLLQLAGAGAAAAAAGIARVRNAIMGLMAASAAAGGGLAGLRAAFLALGVAAKASVVVAGIALAVVAIQKLSSLGRSAPPDVDRLTTSLGNLGRTGKVSGEAAKAFGADLDGLAGSLRMLARPDLDQQIRGTILGLANIDTSQVSAAKKDLDAVDKSLASLVKGGNADLAQAAFERLAEGMKKDGLSSKELKAQLGDYKSALADAKFEQELAAQSMGTFGAAAQRTSAQLNAQKGAADGLRASIVALNDANRSAYDSEIGFEQAVDDLDAAFKKNGNTLDIHTAKGRANGQAMSAAAKAHDEMLAAGLAAGESMGSMAGKSETLRAKMMSLATATLGSKSAATQYVNTLLGTPGSITTQIRLEKEAAIQGLLGVQAEIRKTPGAKSVTVKTLNAAAIAALEAVGLKTRQLPDGRTQVYTANGAALGSIGAVRAALARLDGMSATTYTNHVIRTQYVQMGKKQPGPYAGGYKFNADGGAVDYYANGGLTRGSVQRGGVRRFAGGAEQHVAQFAPAGSWRVWAEPETGGEAYIPLAPWKRRRSKKIAEETVRRLGGKGIAWNADGGVLDQPGVQSFASGGFTYKPTGQTLGGLGDAKERVDKLVSDLREAWKQYDDAVKELSKAKGSKAKAAARRKVSKEKADIAEINASLGQSRYAKAPKHFDLTNYMKQLGKSAAATKKWRDSLAKIAARGGQDVADLLESMGEEGYNLVNRLATASGKHFNEIVKNLKTVAGVANATLKDYTKQLNDTNKVDATFQKNLITLAGQGYGALATQLAGQNDAAAQQLAAEAVKSRSSADKANTAAATQAKTLSSDELADLVQIIAAVKGRTTGLHDVAATTGLGEDDIITIANKASSQIKSSLGDRATQFLADLARANKGLSYANGGIRAGLYATRGGAVTFAEPSTGGEAYIPLGANKRSSATAVLGDVAGRFGLGLTDANSGRVVIVREQGPLVGNQTWNIQSGGDARATARRIDADNAWQLRRLARGGVGARG